MYHFEESFGSEIYSESSYRKNGSSACTFIKFPFLMYHFILLELKREGKCRRFSVIFTAMKLSLVNMLFINDMNLYIFSMHRESFSQRRLGKSTHFFWLATEYFYA